MGCVCCQSPGCCKGPWGWQQWLGWSLPRELLQPARWVQQQRHCCDEAGACRQMAGKSDWTGSGIFSRAASLQRGGKEMAKGWWWVPRSLPYHRPGTCPLFIQLNTLTCFRLLSCTADLSVSKKLWRASKYRRTKSHDKLCCRKMSDNCVSGSVFNHHETFDFTTHLLMDPFYSFLLFMPVWGLTVGGAL